MTSMDNRVDEFSTSIQSADINDRQNASKICSSCITSFMKPAPFSHDKEALAVKEACDYSIGIQLEEAKSGNTPRQVRVYADGVYDMFHSGHARQLMQIKKMIPNAYLIVGVTSDAITLKHKGRTVMQETERYESVRHCRYVDEVKPISYWVLTMDFLKENKIDFVAHDDLPYASESFDDIYKPFKDAGMFLVTQRSEGISTTDVIGRIVRDYDIYLRRNIRRGLSRKDLNISFVKEKKLKMQENFETMVRHGSNLIQNIGSKPLEFVSLLEDMSHEMVRSFVRFFGIDGGLVNWFTDTRNAVKRAISPPREFSKSPPPSPTASYSSSSDLNGYSSRRQRSPFASKLNNRYYSEDVCDDDENDSYSDSGEGDIRSTEDLSSCSTVNENGTSRSNKDDEPEDGNEVLCSDSDEIRDFDYSNSQLFIQPLCGELFHNDWHDKSSGYQEQHCSIDQIHTRLTDKCDNSVCQVKAPNKRGKNVENRSRLNRGHYSERLRKVKDQPNVKLIHTNEPSTKRRCR